jgi:hypothetical protein
MTRQQQTQEARPGSARWSPPRNGLAPERVCCKALNILNKMPVKKDLVHEPEAPKVTRELQFQTL